MEVKPGYIQTEVGIIPEEWEVKSLGELGKFKNGINKGKEDFGHGFPFINLMDVFGIPKVSASTEFGLVNSTAAERKLYELKAGDVLFVRSSVKPEGVGLTTLIPEELRETVFSGFLIRFRDTGLLELGFKEHCFWHKRFRNRLVSNSTFSANTNINQEALKRLQIAFPPSITEQRAIATALSDVDALLGGLDGLIAKKRDLKQAAMQQLLTGQTRLPGFHGEWQMKRLGKLGSFLKGGGVTKDQARSGLKACVRYGELYTRHTDVIHEFYSWISPAVALTATRLSKGDILFAGSGETKEEIGRCAAFISDREAYAGGDIVILRTSDVDALFLGYYLNTPAISRQKANKGQGDAVVHISSRALSEISCTLPTIPEQTAIAGVLADMDAELAALEQRREKTHSLKQAMMQELLTGKTRLVSAITNVGPSPQAEQTAATKPAHNWQINEAVIIGVLARQFGTEEWPLPRKRRVKLTYLLHRHAEGRAEGYLKKAAGQYNPKTKYQGPERIALKNGYVREHNNGTYAGFVAGDKVAQAEQYFAEWYPEAKEWLEQFRFATTDELELLATVDMAVEDLRSGSRAVELKAVKDAIHTHPEWEAKLSRPIFSDDSITRAINKCSNLFAS